MSDLERILEIKDGLHFCHLLAEKPEAVSQNQFLEKFLNSCYNATAGCNCKRRNNLKKLESDFTELYSASSEEEKKIISELFGDIYTNVYLILSNDEKIQLK